MDNPFSITTAISTLALGISGLTAWLTLFRRGTVKMTLPSVIYFGPDGGGSFKEKPSSKVYFRTLLYATSRRGVIIESMYVRLRRGESMQTFNVWVKEDKALIRGAGLHVGETGVECSHYFLLPADGTSFEFLPGNYILEVFASLAGNDKILKLHAVELVVTESMARELKDANNGLYFDWGPDSRKYHSHIRPRESEDSL